MEKARRAAAGLEPESELEENGYTSVSEVGGSGTRQRKVFVQFLYRVLGLDEREILRGTVKEIEVVLRNYYTGTQ